MPRPQHPQRLQRMQQRLVDPVAFTRCIQYVLWHLSRQNLSTKEIISKIATHFGNDWAQRLQPPEPGHPLNQELDWSQGAFAAFEQWLEQCPYQSDRARAHSVVRSSQAKHSTRTIIQKLVHKMGSDSLHLVEEEIQALKDSETSRVLALIELKISKAPNPHADPAAYLQWKLKTSASLARKGFSWDTIQQAWKQLNQR